MKRHVNDETRAFMEEQFAECLDFEQLADLYADFHRILRELLLSSLEPQEEIKATEQPKYKAIDVANFVTEIVFAEKETVLRALEEDDEGMLQDEIYYYIQECE